MQVGSFSTPNLSSGTALQQNFVIRKVGSKLLMMNNKRVEAEFPRVYELNKRQDHVHNVWCLDPMNMERTSLRGFRTIRQFTHSTPPETLSWNLKGSSRYQPLKTPLCRLNVPYAVRWDDLDRWYCVWCRRRQHYLWSQRRRREATASRLCNCQSPKDWKQSARDTLRPVAVRPDAAFSTFFGSLCHNSIGRPRW